MHPARQTGHILSPRTVFASVQTAGLSVFSYSGNRWKRTQSPLAVKCLQRMDLQAYLAIRP